jgi:hypothetical protein
VEVDERADSASSCCQLRRQAVDGGVLGRVAGGYAPVGLAAGVGCRAALWWLRCPLEDPVAIAVGAEAGCVQRWAWLPVLAPEAIGGLCVDKAYSVLMSG